MSLALEPLHKSIDSLAATVRQAILNGNHQANQFSATAAVAANRIREELQATAEEKGLSPLRIARNLVATTSLSRLRQIRDLLEFWFLHGPFEPAAAHRGLIDAIPADQWGDPVLYWLLLGGKAPRIGAAAAFFGRQTSLLLTYEREVLRGNSPSDAAATARLLNAIGDYLGHSDRASFVNEGFRRGLSPLDEARFQKLRPGIRRWILADRSFSAIALVPELDSAIRAEPLNHRDTPEATAERTWRTRTLPSAFQDLRRRSLSSGAVTTLLQRADVEDHSDRILLELGRRNPFTSGSKLEPPAGLASWSNRLLRNAISFFAERPEDRMGFLTSMDLTDREQLAGAISPPEWIAAVQDCPSQTSLEETKQLVLGNAAHRQHLWRAFSGFTKGGPAFSVYFLDYLQAADVAMLRKMVAHQPKTLRRWKTADLERPAFRKLIEGYFAKPAPFAILISFAPQAILETLFCSPLPWIRDWREHHERRSRQSRSLPYRFYFLEQVFRFSPELMELPMAWTISRPGFRALLARLTEADCGIPQDVLLRFTDSKGNPHWEAFVIGKNRSTVIRRLIRKEHRDLFPKLLQIEADALVRDRGIQKKLRAVLVGKAPVESLRLSQRKLRLFIPWARKAWEKKPTAAAAYELALAFSIRDARHLLFLCTERWTSPERDRGGHVFDHHYRTHTIPKKSGGKRTITAPDERLKRLQRRILRNGFGKVFIHSAAHGFKRGRSILTNAIPHVGKPCVVNVDIQSFFPSTRHRNILHACSTMLEGVLSEGACRVLADLCSFGGALPTGAPTSPAIANLILRSADAAITKAAEANGITYTRYADDLTFSGESNVLKLLPFVEKVLGQLGYQLDPKKTNIFRRGRRQMVTGLVVNDKPNLPRRIRRRLRAAVHRQSSGEEAHWHGRPMSKDELTGRLSHLQLVQPEEAVALKRKLKGAPPDQNGAQDS